jgi:hypothetical protein
MNCDQIVDRGPDATQVIGEWINYLMSLLNEMI